VLDLSVYYAVRNHAPGLKQGIGQQIVERTDDQSGHYVDTQARYDDREDQVGQDDLVSDIGEEETPYPLEPPGRFF
jgi:hypothetical protein